MTKKFQSEHDEYMEQIAFMLKKADERFEEQQRNPNPLADQLIEACTHSQVGKVKYLLKKGATPNVVRANGTPAGSAICARDAMEILSLLVQASANLNLQDQNGWSPLFIAAGNGFVEIVSLLVKSGADTNLPTPSNGWTPLMNAACFGSAKTVVELLTHGANPEIRSVDGLTAPDIAKANGHRQVTQIFIKYFELLAKR